MKITLMNKDSPVLWVPFFDEFTIALQHSIYSVTINTDTKVF